MSTNLNPNAPLSLYFNSVAKINDYHHPHDITLKKLNELETKIYRTDQEGTIILSSDGENYYFETIKTDTNNE